LDQEDFYLLQPTCKRFVCMNIFHFVKKLSMLVWPQTVVDEVEDDWPEHFSQHLFEPSRQFVEFYFRSYASCTWKELL